jgi:hypothetical protein
MPLGPEARLLEAPEQERDDSQEPPLRLTDHRIVREDNRSGAAWLAGNRKGVSSEQLRESEKLYGRWQRRWESGWLPVLDKLRTLNEIDPETVELLTL